MDADRRFYSVTTIIGALDKPALLFWAAEQTALAAVRMAGSLEARVEEEGAEAVVRYLRDARKRPPPGQVSATALGTAVHDAVERYVKEGKRPDVGVTVLPYLEQFDRWAQVWQPEYHVTEASVYSPRYQYAGTLDAICTIEGCKVLVDYKSSRRSVGPDDKPSRPYPEAALQLAAYRHAELLATVRGRRTEVLGRRYYLFGAEEAASAVPMSTLDGSVVVHITPEHCDMYPVRSDDRVFEAFLYTVEAFRWQQELSKQVIGERSTKEAEEPETLKPKALVPSPRRLYPGHKPTALVPKTPKPRARPQRAISGAADGGLQEAVRIAENRKPQQAEGA